MSPMLRSLVLAAVLASTLLCGGTDACARRVRVGIGYAIPPYVIAHEDAGLEVDIIRSALRAAGLEARFVYLPNLRLPLALAQGEVDCVAVNAGYDLGREAGMPVHGSATTIVFQNYAVSLASRRLKIDGIGDLDGWVVLGFHNAINYLGPEFRAMAEANSLYSELSDQALQVRLLFSGRVDVVVSERRVFLYWRNRLKSSPAAKSVDLDQTVVFNRIFEPSPRHVAFADEALCARFNEGLAAIRANGTYAGIILRYDQVEYHPGN